MKLKVIGFLTLLICVIVISCQSDAEQDFKRYYTGGAAIYKTNCQNCHGANGEGLSSLIPPLTDSAYLNKNRNQLSCFVKYGIKETIIIIKGKAYEGAMPANVDLPAIDVAKVLTYVGNSFGNKMGTIPVDVVDADLAKCD
ncbi:MULTISPECIES: cytochrome c [unclassified Mucilaginibacter]|uniref:c-type cytochrome n=1 Tax=unclassified Mucilaginibacter TaxID=2617802 RepID=UPI002AC8C030|nr:MULTISPECIES: cytochrome c [unclassified Mucilaginibacter]MEB0261387.1 cytochrome c [Mucilaginibacter sp. 10I4]MEB0278854.1 cytochrome c [Mucilaginibacter sp. 10B2]MEB0299780.1 cytochrome c [Mucilaginibacter sp. 5C4]WPX22036.1 cytochrome c [Mucilaginibacter sp. 5C4]